VGEEKLDDGHVTCRRRVEGVWWRHKQQQQQQQQQQDVDGCETISRRKVQASVALLVRNIWVEGASGVDENLEQQRLAPCGGSLVRCGLIYAQIRENLKKI
jgi:hypothetical protein